MADLNPKDSSLLVGVVGLDSNTGETTPVNATTGGGLHINLRDNAGAELVGQKTMTNSVPVTISSNQTPVPVTPLLPPNYSRGVFGGQRVVSTQNVFESLFSFDKQPTIWDEVVVTGGTSTFNTNTCSVDMSTNTASGASVIRQTFRRIRYNPSRACQLITSAILGLAKANVRKRIGQFDERDGLFFEQDGTGMSIVRRTSTSGTPVDIKVSQANWNVDKFDGTGPSGITIDFSKQQAFYIQYAFQGFADICYGFYLNGQISFCHREVTSNTLNQPFMRSAHLPVRVEITNTGVTASSTTISYNSAAVKNEGEDSEVEGQVRAYSEQPLKSIGTTLVPVLSVKFAPGYEKAIADIISTTIFVQTADEVIWSLWLAPTLTGATFAISASYTVVDIAATSMSGGVQLIAGVLTQANNSGSLSQDLLKLVNSVLGSSINNVPQIITLAARSRATAADILTTLVWREYP